MNYDYNKIENGKSSNFPYGTESVFVLKKQDILFYKAMHYEDKTGMHYQVRIILKGNDSTIVAYFNNSDEVKEAMNALDNFRFSTVYVARAKTKDDKTFQRDFITNSIGLYEEAIANL